jgi:hypothetical protein
MKYRGPNYERSLRHKEWGIIKQTASNNNIQIHLLTKLRCNIQKNLSQPHLPTTSIQDKKWATFTHSSPHARKITNLFKNTNVKVTFKSNNTIAQLTKPHTTTIKPPNPHDMSSIYSLTYNT